MSQTDGDGINQFQQRKLAEQLAIGIAVRNATPEQLGHKVKKEEIITVSAKAAGEEAAAWAAKCAAQKQHPSRTTWQNVLFGIRRAPSPSGYQNSTARESCHRQPDQPAIESTARAPGPAALP